MKVLIIDDPMVARTFERLAGMANFEHLSACSVSEMTRKETYDGVDIIVADFDHWWGLLVPKVMHLWGDRPFIIAAGGSLDGIPEDIKKKATIILEKPLAAEKLRGALLEVRSQLTATRQ